MKVIAFAGSNSSQSINHQLVSHIGREKENVEVIQLTEYDIPMYSIDIEKNEGIPAAVQDLSKKLSEADSYIISVAEHNGNVSAFFKNILDWLSRNNRNFLADKKVVVLSTSPGGRGGASALAVTEKMLPYFGATIAGTLSIGNFHNHFKDGQLQSEEIKKQLEEVIHH